VHETRKSIKRLRAIVRLAGTMAPDKALKRFASPLREAAHRLGPLRDAVVLRKTTHELKRRGEPRPPAPDVIDSKPLLLHARAALRKADAALGGVLDVRWKIRRAEEGLAELYRHARKAMRRAEKSGSDEDLHAWRRRAKDLVYAVEVAQDSRVGRAVANKLKRLAEYLGDDHDLAFLEQHVANRSDRDTHHALLRRSARRRRPLQKKAFRLGENLFRGGARKFARRVLG
jgi:CHAD domain-containing protein